MGVSRDEGRQFKNGEPKKRASKDSWGVNDRHLLLATRRRSEGVSRAVKASGSSSRIAWLSRDGNHC